MTVPDDNAAQAARAPRWLLVAGLAAGAALGAAGLRVAPAPALPPGAVARVDGQVILRDAWLRAVAAVESDRRAPLTEDDHRHILERLIDEELLVQHGVALGLVERDARLRGTLVSQVMQAAAQAARVEPDEATLRAWFDAHRERFTPAARLRVRAWRVGADGARAPFAPPVPDALLPPAKLQAYLGPALTRRAMELAPGATVDTGEVVLEVVESQPGAAPPFEAVRLEVRRELLRRADEAAVRALLAELRERTPIVIAAGRP
jgi:hypothetical protein